MKGKCENGQSGTRTKSHAGLVIMTACLLLCILLLFLMLDKCLVFLSTNDQIPLSLWIIGLKLQEYTNESSWMKGWLSWVWVKLEVKVLKKCIEA